MIAPEGSEDCRGQGQWKSAEQQAISAAMLVSKSERELTEEAVKERDTLRQDHEALKVCTSLKDNLRIICLFKKLVFYYSNIYV